ncbi:AAA+ ATPase domain-containing protein [Artemisia annua]|uniref:AAA+ ATPase domain-containing protein n=1 Tax=Artemisia annua TaxID=35608 RepID=A0A2U1KGC7_ARTAN|nr:AAA+ ATPase domain-containing protein [Artemisia annua]
MAVRATFLNHQATQVSQAYMDALIPDPTPANIRKYKKGLWRKSMPKGLKMKKFIEGPEGTLIHDTSYVGEDAWDDEDDDDATVSKNKVKEIIDRDGRLNTENKSKLQEELGLSATVCKSNSFIWQMLTKRVEEHGKKGYIYGKTFLAEQLESSRAKYAIEFDMKEVEKSFCEDAKVDMPLDPYLFEMITNSGAEVDLLQKKQSHYLLKLVIALLPGILVLWFLRESLMLLHITSKRFLYKKYNQLFDMAYAENFILPVREVDDTKSMYKDVVLGGDVWDLLDELMIYMRNPMQYYEKEVKFVRGVLLSGPPGTGKTLFARTLAKESGMPFVFASGAEFTDSEKSGAARINQMFSIARRNAPAFIFVDEIDAIAGRHARKDPRRRSTFDALIAQLDGEKEKTGVDRFSLRQAVIFICATNRPDELDLEFVQAGRIDRRLYIGLPDAKQRVQIFGVHSTGKQLAEDVKFENVILWNFSFLVNFAVINLIMILLGPNSLSLTAGVSYRRVRRGHTKIYQKDIVDVLDKQLLEGMGVLLTEEEQQKCEERVGIYFPLDVSISSILVRVSIEKKRLLAVHEAGHILLAHLFPRFDWHAFSQLLPGGKETAVSVFYPREDMVDQGYTTFGYMMMQMVVAHGGRCAERVVFGDDVTDGGVDDLEKITKVVYCFFTRFFSF